MGLKRRRSTPPLQSNINVTPFVDVMLVLLIIFMVAAPTMQSGISVDLPQGKKGEAVSSEAPVVISLDKAGNLFLRNEEMAPEKLVATLRTLPPATTEKIYIRADKTLSYDQVVRLMTLLSSQGFSKLILVTESSS